MKSKAILPGAGLADKAVDGGAKKGTRRKFYLFGGVFVGFVIAVLWGASVVKGGWKRREDQRFLQDVALIQEAFTQLAEGSADHSLSPIESKGNATVDPEISKTPISGNWQIQQTQRGDGRVLTEIVVTNPNRSMREMEKLDAQIDDGNLSTGNFVLKGKDSYGIGVMESHTPAAPPEDVSIYRKRTVINDKELDQNYLKRSDMTRDGR